MEIKTILFLALAFCLDTQADINYDKFEELNGVKLATGKIDSIRHYTGSSVRTIPAAINIVLNSITNYSEKCNSALKDKRKLTLKKQDCRYHVEDVVETKLLKQINNDSSLLAKHLYRKGSYLHHELLSIVNGKNEKNQSTITVTFKMLTDPEVASYIQAEFKNDSDFTESLEKYVLTGTGPRETEVSYQYITQTRHWLLNKEISVPQVFASISSHVNDQFKTLEEGSIHRNREVASRK